MKDQTPQADVSEMLVRRGDHCAILWRLSFQQLHRRFFPWLKAYRLERPKTTSK